MTTNLNSFILPDSVIQKMKVKVEETKLKKVELGFGLCHPKRTNVLTAGEDCTGSQCALEPPRECDIGTFIGGFHTHPRTGSDDPSISDLSIAYTHDVECIGSAIDDKIKCYLKSGSKIPDEEERINKLSKEIEEPLGEKPTIEEYEKWRNIRNDILNKYFKAIDII